MDVRYRATGRVVWLGMRGGEGGGTERERERKRGEEEKKKRRGRWWVVGENKGESADLQPD